MKDVLGLIGTVIVIVFGTVIGGVFLILFHEFKK